MAREIRRFEFTIPAGTTKAAPFTQQQSFPPRIVSQINVRVPPGPAGQMGFQVGSSGNPVIPREDGVWMVTDDELMEWPLVDFWDSGSWEFFGYNLGQFDHTVYFTFLCDLVPVPPAPPITVIPAADLSSVGAPGSSTAVPPTASTPAATPSGTLPGSAQVPPAAPVSVPPPPVVAPPPVLQEPGTGQGQPLPPPPV